MVQALITIIINTAAFVGISKFLPGFQIKDEKTAAVIAVAYSILGYLLSIVTLPLVAIVTIGLTMFAFIPVIGPLIAGAGIFVTVFLVSFILSVIMLMAIDKFLEDFKMESPLVAVKAALALGIINVVVRAVLPGI